MAFICHDFLGLRDSDMKIRIALLTVAGLLGLNSAIAQTFTNLHSLAFTNGTGPVANLIISGTTLYGTTRIYGGGTGGGYGSVFKMNTDGSAFTNLHTFSGIAPEGGNLDGGLVLLGGMLYSSAAFGGAFNSGSLFAISTNGLTQSNIYNFSSLSYTNSDGAYPLSGLLLSGGTFYGTANGGGTAAAGTLFAVSTNGSGYTNLHNFAFSTGQYPERDLLLSGGMLYGTTPAGGTYAVGTVFKISTNGTGYTNFYNFTQPSGTDNTNSDGAFPKCNLVLFGQTLFGTTSEGGNLGGGTVFAINTDGTGFNILHSFATTNDPSAVNIDGARPESGLTLAGNVLYGTTSTGGSGGNGTLFKIKTDGSGFATVYNFSSTNNPSGTNTDGAHPIGALLYSGSALYGTASAGGEFGYGTIFSVLYPPTLTITVVGTNAIITWPSDTTGFTLQSTTNLTPAPVWTTVPGQYNVTNPITSRQKFYRLTHP